MPQSLQTLLALAAGFGGAALAWILFSPEVPTGQELPSVSQEPSQNLEEVLVLRERVEELELSLGILQRQLEQRGRTEVVSSQAPADLPELGLETRPEDQALALSTMDSTFDARVEAVLLAREERERQEREARRQEERERRMNDRVARLGEELGLDQYQQDQMKRILTEADQKRRDYFEDLQRRRDTGEEMDRNQVRDFMRQIGEDSLAQAQNVLTPAQYEQYQSRNNNRNWFDASRRGGNDRNQRR
ncbi:MAG: hypothetical protein DWQ01_06320 [Planctomycetota bacterium]|nr:MAG: hypothetical protein DWQ01_06320 [Planctomycetota bacterium]